MGELLGVVARAAADAGADVSSHVGRFPVIPEPHVCVVIPHEYFRLTAPEDQPTQAQRLRTIGFCVEHPGNQTFEVSASHAASLGALFDINSDSVEELRRRGLPAERFTLGYSPLLDAWGGDAASPRPIDITYMGTTDARRDALLALQAKTLSRWNCRLLIPPHEQMTRPRQDFLMGRAKLRHLAQTKVILNLHRGGSQALEWVRVLEAMVNGCVVVSERSTDFEPLIPGIHILFARPLVAASVAEAVLRNPDRLEGIRRDAYSFCRDLDMRPSAGRLVDVADTLARGAAPPRSRALSLDTTHRRPLVPEPPQPEDGLPALSQWAAQVPSPLRRLYANILDSAALGIRARITHHHRKGPDGAAAIAALVIKSPAAAGGLTRTLRSLERQELRVHTLVIGWDEPIAQALDFGLPRGRLLNAAFAEVTADYVVILEAGHELFPNALTRLIKAIDTTTTEQPPSIAYGMMADELGGGLWNSLPWEPARLARRVYLTAPLMVRAKVLQRGFSESPALIGYEYHELLCRLAEAGQGAAFVQELIGSGRRPPSPALIRAQISPVDTRRALQATASTLLRNMPTAR